MKHPLNTAKSITLIELIISLLVVTIMVLSFYGLETFSHGQVINSERRAKVQNQLAYALEHMSKYVQQANGYIGDSGDPAKTKPAIVLTASGFQARVDFSNPQTPSDLADDAWVSYSLSGNTLSASCSGSAGCPFATETLSSQIIGNFVADAIMPNNPANGFYVKVNSLGNLVDIGLAGRYNTSGPPSLSNPQVEMKTKIISNNSSVN